MKSFVRVAVLVSMAWFPSIHAAQPAAVPSKGTGNGVVKQGPILDLESWFKDKIRRLGTTILPASLAPDATCVPADDPNGCIGIDRTKCPIG